MLTTQTRWLKLNIPFFVTAFVAALVVPMAFAIPTCAAIVTAQIWINMGA